MDEAIQVLTDEPQFTQQWANETAGVPVPLSALLKANADDESLCEWLSGAEVGEDITTGGGAAPACTLRRIA